MVEDAKRRHSWAIPTAPAASWWNPAAEWWIGSLAALQAKVKKENEI